MQDTPLFSGSPFPSQQNQQNQQNQHEQQKEEEEVKLSSSSSSNPSYDQHFLQQVPPSNTFNINQYDRHSILQTPLSRIRPEVSLSAFGFMISELVQYNQNLINSINDFERRLEEAGYHVGRRIIEYIAYHEKFIRRETNVVNMLQFICNDAWKFLFQKSADGLERSFDNNNEFKIHENNPLTNRYVSLPGDMDNLNCAAFIAGIIAGVLDSCYFNAIVTAHIVNMDSNSDYSKKDVDNINSDIYHDDANNTKDMSNFNKNEIENNNIDSDSVIQPGTTISSIPKQTNIETTRDDLNDKNINICSNNKEENDNNNYYNLNDDIITTTNISNTRMNNTSMNNNVDDHNKIDNDDNNNNNTEQGIGSITATVFLIKFS